MIKPLNIDIDIEMILKFHNQPDSYIPFMKKDKNGKFINFGAWKQSDLKQYFKCLLPIFVENLSENSYFSINSFYSGAMIPGKRTSAGHADFHRGKGYLRYLNACYVDLDVGRPDSKDPNARQTWREAVFLSTLFMDKGLIPHASIIAKSGRGIYLFYILNDKKDPSKRPGAFKEKLLIQNKINHALHDRLKMLASDRSALDAVRVFRLPGSINTKAPQTPVKYILHFDKYNNSYEYTLDELAEFFKIPVFKNELGEIIKIIEKPLYRKTINKGSAPGRKKGMIALNADRINDLLNIELWRGGWKKGRRRRSIIIYSEFLKNIGINKNKNLEYITGMSKRCSPVYPSDKTDTPLNEIIDVIYSGEKGSIRKWSNIKLCKEFDITLELAEKDLDLITIIPPALSIKRKSQPGKREIETSKLKEAIINLIKIRKPFNSIPSYRKLEKYFKEEMHINRSRTSIKKYFNEVCKDKEILEIITGKPEK